MIHTILPRACSVEVSPAKPPKRAILGKEYVKFRYSETFHPSQALASEPIEASLDRTFRVVDDLFRKMNAGLRVRYLHKKWTFIVEGKCVPKEVVGNMLTGEFLGWGTIGNSSIRDLMIGGLFTGADTK